MLNYKYSHYVSIIGRIFVYFINFAINLEDMSNFIKDYYRRKRLKDSAHLNIGTFTNLKDVESVSFAYGIESPADIADVIEIFKFLKWRSVKIRALVIETKKGVFDKIEELETLNAEEGLYKVGYNDLDWLGDLKCGVADEFFDSESNLFINFNSVPNFTLSRVVQRVKSSMKIGKRNEADIPYNFIVGGKDGELLDNIEFLTQIFHYLKIFNK